MQTEHALDIAKHLVSDLADPAILFDAQLRPIHFNLPMSQLVGGKRRRLRGANVTAMAAIELVSSDVERDVTHLTRCFQECQAIHLANVPVPTEDGARTMMLSFLPIQSAGAVAGVILKMRDVSVEAHLHQRYRELIAAAKARSDDLERKVQERTKQLTAALAEVTRLSNHDPLTGVHNRRAFTEFAQQAIGLAERHSRCVGIVLMDLDFFKRLNDDYGHQAGDAVLKRVAETLGEQIRSSDRLARFGGEEFIVLLAETTPEGVLLAAERFRHAIEALAIAEIVPDCGRSQTISLGVARFPEHGENLDRLVACADDALYRAKALGRNRVVLYEEHAEADQLAAGTSRFREERLLVVSADAAIQKRCRAILSELCDVAVETDVARALEQVGRNGHSALVVDGRLDDAPRLLAEAARNQPLAVRLLIVPSGNPTQLWESLSAHVDQLLVADELEKHLLRSLTDAALRREWFRDEMLRVADFGLQEEKVQAETLDEILRDRAIYIAMQPIISARNGQAVACEAFCRSHHPRFVAPPMLFDAALRFGKIWELTKLVYEKIAISEPRIRSGLSIFVNVHPSETTADAPVFAMKPFTPFAHRVVFEFNERALSPSPRELTRLIPTLQQRGFRVAIDGLGAGNADLKNVIALAPDYLKLDRTLTAHLDRSGVKYDIVRNICERADEAGIEVIAVGVATESEAGVVAEVGCDLMQGFYFGHPEAVETS
ncbi:MAG: bifunctional diguanylate cyclase/phosphodiesterase [Myxococcales bacterium]|nr:bifunctional diguanylate cyclase/phosphodiesterase [Myxococcales bacterium]